jgi:hypothetical protein
MSPSIPECEKLCSVCRMADITPLLTNPVKDERQMIGPFENGLDVVNCALCRLLSCAIAPQALQLPNSGSSKLELSSGVSKSHYPDQTQGLGSYNLPQMTMALAPRAHCLRIQIAVKAKDFQPGRAEPVSDRQEPPFYYHVLTPPGCNQ